MRLTKEEVGPHSCYRCISAFFIMHARATKQARHPLIRRLAPVVEALCLLPSLPLALWEGCLAHARTLLLQLPSQGKEEKKKDGGKMWTANFME